MANNTRITSKEVIHHSDRGLQYCSSLYQTELKRSNVIPSMTDGDDCYQNALAERINGILKGEFLINKCNTGKELKLLVQQSIKTYNNERQPYRGDQDSRNSFVSKPCLFFCRCFKSF